MQEKSETGDDSILASRQLRAVYCSLAKQRARATDGHSVAGDRLSARHHAAGAMALAGQVSHHPCRHEPL